MGSWKPGRNAPSVSCCSILIGLRLTPGTTGDLIRNSDAAGTLPTTHLPRDCE